MTKVNRKVGAKSIIQYMVYHQSRANWLRKNKKLREADQHQAEFQEAYETATANEKATFDFISQNLGVPSFPNVKGYEAYPLPIGRSAGVASKWFKDDPKQRKSFISLPVPMDFLAQVKERTKHLAPVDRGDMLRDSIAKSFGIKIPE